MRSAWNTPSWLRFGGQASQGPAHSRLRLSRTHPRTRTSSSCLDSSLSSGANTTHHILPGVSPMIRSGPASCRRDGQPWRAGRWRRVEGVTERTNKWGTQLCPPRQIRSITCCGDSGPAPARPVRQLIRTTHRPLFKAFHQTSPAHCSRWPCSPHSCRNV